MRDDRRRTDEPRQEAASTLAAPELNADLKPDLNAALAGPAEWNFQWHDLTFTVRESARRKTVSLGLERDGQLLILAPANTPPGQLERLVTARQDWLYGKLAERASLSTSRREREYVSGEGFWHAGRSYRLLVRPAAESPVSAPLSLQGGRFRLHQEHADQGRALFTEWYAEHLHVWAEEQLRQLRPRLRVQPSRIRVTDLGHRWGACSAAHEVSLHWRVALLPRRMAEYVLLHELVHLEHHHHRAAFWDRLGVLLPDYLDRKGWLARHGADYDL
ncbi:M48 family metallopeptidase [Deinococcus soli (ex Cha et al. 2016)]|uniref:M48 family metallopeptidase n=1 Tax=Deinococcus soli (ex Cha et al. 2016) TaxID=1309411 RepID=UPI001664C780|nr:YgjP-like metallopeptidase domain-containing protein [Deinococcus soli (ex Cha et al. 2016)]GGB54955.1 metal-dependent hydrolase [Deinococcus soli (ex Cha et al. 2016)]